MIGVVEYMAPPAPAAEKVAGTIASVIAQWGTEGPLVHESSGIQALDDLTGGGPVYGSRWYLAGAPDAGKTALLIQLGDVWARKGVTVGFLAVDEEPADLAARFAQRKGWRRSDTESRHPDTLAEMTDALGSLPVRFYDASWTIESAAEDLHKAANGGRAALLIDSIQTVQCEAERLAEREMSEVAAVTARTRAIRRVASCYRIIAVATSELGRASYATEEARRTTSTLAGGKWSGAIEYSARVLIGVRSVAGEPDLIDLELAKNKHGPRDAHVYLRIDRASQSLWPVEYEPEPEESREGRRDERAQGRVRGDAKTVADILRQHSGIGVRELRAQVRAACGAGHERVEAALAYLGAAVIRGKGPRNSVPLSLDTDSLPSDWRDRA